MEPLKPQAAPKDGWQLANYDPSAHELIWEQNLPWSRTLLALDALLLHGTVLDCVMFFAGITVYLACTPRR